MKSRNFFTLIFFFLIAFQLLAQETVFVESTQKGKGILKSRSGECFVITPEHVVHEDASVLSITGSKNVLSNGKLVQAMEDLDIAIIRVTDGGTQNCTNWSVPSNYTSILDNTVDAYLELRDENGGTQLIQVFINGKDEESISIVPKLSKDIFIKGMSGGSLFTQYEGKKIYLGMLQEIGEEGEGYVFQADDMERILGGFFGDTPKQSSITSMNTTTAEPSAISVEEDGYRFDLISLKKSGTNVVCKLKVTSLEKDGKLLVWARQHTKIYDQNGIEKIADKVILGGKMNNYNIGGNYTLVKGIPAPLELYFKDVESDATGLSYIKIVVTNHKSNSDFNVEFKNISFDGMTSNIVIPKFENIEHSHEEDGYRFDLISVKKSGTNVVCKLRVTSLEKDGKLLVWARQHTKIYDQNGIEKIADKVILGGKMNNYNIGGNYTLVKGIPAPLELYFKDVESDATGLSYIKIVVTNHKSNSDFNVEFKNISFDGMTSNIVIPKFENIEHSHEEDGYRFDLISVKKSGTNVVCKLRVTSLEKDGKLLVWARQHTKIYDQNGIEKIADKVILGGKMNNYNIGGNYTLVKGIPAPLELYFKDVESDATGLSYIKIVVTNHKSNSDFNVEFRNISF